MASSGLDAKIPPEAVLNLRDRLKHGQNVTKILESQLDTAQQNISLLQGQVRLANETILNLKKHFQETENILSQLLSPDQQSRLSNFELDADGLRKHGSVDSTTRSPPPTDASSESNKSYDEKSENNKSPYAIQLRQVLDVLQDEEPRKGVLLHHPESQSTKDCNCSDCQSPRKQYMDVMKECDCGNSSCTVEHYHHRKEDFCKAKHKMNGHSTNHHHHERAVSPKSYGGSEPPPHIVHSSYSNHCTGPCCVNGEGAGYKVVEKSPGPVHYVSVHSPVHIPESISKHSDRHHGHCGEKCQCHATYVNYVPYGYHIVENNLGIPDSMQPMSPSARRKRPFLPLHPGEEPPHLKYTKVKRIDGSKLTAQKVLQDFTKRRYLPYNPRYDLDLLIVPPPVPAIDLLKSRKSHHPEPPKQINEQYPAGSPPHQPKSITFHEESPIEEVNGTNDLVKQPNNNNNNSIFNHNLKPPTSGFKGLHTIKEESRDGHGKLEEHISKLRKDSMSTTRSLSPLINRHREQDCNNVNVLKQERNMSPVSVGNRVS